MSNFLRDTFIKNISLNEDRLRKINDVFVELAVSNNQGLQNTEEDTKKYILLKYIIRFDNKGFLLNEFDKVIKYLQGSKKTERIIFHLDSNESYFSNAQYGKKVELRFDANNPNNCHLTVQDDNSDWVDSTFCKIEEELNKYKNKHFLVRNAWTPFFVQIFGVLVGFILSLWAALRIAPALSIDYGFIVSFVLAFLIFSNVWTYLNQQILNLINFFFPNITFKDSKGLHWLAKSLLSAIFVAISLFVINKIFIYVGLLLKEVLK